jgi:hypothetical protein
MKKTFIYGLFSDSDKVIRYVGKSDNPEYRLKRHIYQRNDSKTHKNNWINKLLDNNEKLLYKILEVVDYDKWSEKEKKWISKFDNLVNTSEGGLGGASIKYNITYLECKKWIVDNLVDIDSKTKWYNNVSNLPVFIPKNPREVFLKRGWISWGDFLSTNRIQDNRKIKYISYEDAKKYIVDSSLTQLTSKDWRKIEIPIFIPRRPERYYKNRGWIDWSDFLSNDKIQNQKKVFLDFDEFILYVNKNVISVKNRNEWRSIVKTLPNYIPSEPSLYYKGKGWISWKDFFNKINK